MNDPQIAAALRARSPGALAELFDAYGDRLFRYCWCLLRNREIAQIALRDTLVVAEAHIARLADPQSLGPWLYSLARAECRRRRAVRAAEADEPPARPSQRDADSRLMAWNAVMSLEADELEVLDLACRHDVDLGLVLSLTAEDAQALLDRARRSLERALGAEILISRASHACPDRARAGAPCGGGGGAAWAGASARAFARGGPPGQPAAGREPPPTAAAASPTGSGVQRRSGVGAAAAAPVGARRSRPRPSPPLANTAPGQVAALITAATAPLPPSTPPPPHPRVPGPPPPTRPWTAPPGPP